MPIKKNNTYFQEDGKVYYYDEYGIQQDIPTSAFGDLDQKKYDISSFSAISGTFYTTDNPCGFITKSVDNLENYYTKNETYTQTEIDEKIGSIGSFVIATLKDDVPDVPDPSTKVIYLTKDESLTATDPYTEWIYTNDEWVIIGETTVDLSNYYTTSQTSGSEQLTAEFAKYVHTANTGSWDVTNYSGKDGVYVSNHEIGLSANYKTAVESVSGKLDTSIYETNSATFYTKDNPSGFITGVDLTPYQPISAMSDYYTKSQTSAASELSIEFEKYVQTATTESWDVTEYSGINGIDITSHKVGLSSDYKLAVESVSSKLDTSAFSDVSGTFVTTSTIFSGSTPGLVPVATNADAAKALRGDGTWGDVSNVTVTYDSTNEELHLDFSNGGN